MPARLDTRCCGPRVRPDAEGRQDRRMFACRSLPR